MEATNGGASTASKSLDRRCGLQIFGQEVHFTRKALVVRGEKTIFSMWKGSSKKFLEHPDDRGDSPDHANEHVASTQQ